MSRKEIEQDILEHVTGLTQEQEIFYSNRYYDEEFEYRHVIVPKQIARWIPQKLMSDQEWRSFGIKQSQGWVHYMIHSTII